MQELWVNPKFRIRHIRICMNWQNVAFDWNQVRAFLVTAEEGSMSAAARALNLTQPTLSRQVAGLEDQLNVTLFERAGRRLILTDTGHTLLSHVRDMGTAAAALSLAASSRSDRIEGEVKVTATDMASAFLLPPILSRLAKTAPGITVGVVAANDIRDLQRREADIALRNAAPTEPELVAQRLKDMHACFCASPAFLDDYGPITTLAELERAPWVGYSEPEQMSQDLKPLGLNIAPDRFRYHCQTGFVISEMVRQGLGVSILTSDTIRATPGLVTLLPDHPPIPVPLYLIAHREMRTSARIRTVWTALAQALGSPNRRS